jgi:hypothetical protein
VVAERDSGAATVDRTLAAFDRVERFRDAGAG